MYAGGKNKSDMFGCGYILISKCSDPYNTGNKAYVFPVSYCLWDLYLNTFEKV